MHHPFPNFARHRCARHKADPSPVARAASGPRNISRPRRTDAAAHAVILWSIVAHSRCSDAHTRDTRIAASFTRHNFSHTAHVVCWHTPGKSCAVDVRARCWLITTGPSPPSGAVRTRRSRKSFFHFIHLSTRPGICKIWQTNRPSEQVRNSAQRSKRTRTYSCRVCTSGAGPLGCWAPCSHDYHALRHSAISDISDPETVRNEYAIG
jgi:hypothetical protein